MRDGKATIVLLVSQLVVPTVVLWLDWTASSRMKDSKSDCIPDVDVKVVKPTVDVKNVIHLDWSSFYPMMFKMQMFSTTV